MNVIQNKIVGSMMWSAYGDALGFMSELVDTAGLVSRTGLTKVETTESWTYKLGGRYGAPIRLPAGMYSDDTQLRLATSRALGRDGQFNIDAFSKIELPVWLSYSLGGGKGTKAAAANLARNNVAWYSNFYQTTDAKYLDSGGNGAAMRIQPHVWAAGKSLRLESLLLDVVRNAISTHGHPRAIVGAALHALTLYQTFQFRRVPGAADWKEALKPLRELRAIILHDDKIRLIWLTEWERRCGSFSAAINSAVDECLTDIQTFTSLSIQEPHSDYLDFLGRIGGFDRSTRGSGTKTAVASLVLAALFSDAPDEALRVSANALGSDTDTIGSMAGALLGVVSATLPPGQLCDREMLEAQALRLSSIASGSNIPDFAYPSLIDWQPPRTASDSVRKLGAEFGLIGLGTLKFLDEIPVISLPKQGTMFRGARTSFGQTLILKMRGDAEILDASQMPRSTPPTMTEAVPRIPHEHSPTAASSTPKASKRWAPSDFPARGEDIDPTYRGVSVEDATQLAIKSDFDPKVIGEQLLRLCSDERAIEKSIAFAAIVAKARTARKRR